MYVYVYVYEYVYVYVYVNVYVYVMYARESNTPIYFLYNPSDAHISLRLSDPTGTSKTTWCYQR